MPISKYKRQTASARKTIMRKGTLCTWFKDADTDASDNTSPEFPTNDEPTAYPKVPIVFYPQDRQNLATVLAATVTGSFTDNLFAIIPGDLPFKPAKDDAVQLTNADGTTFIAHVDWINTIQPDLVPIVYEIGFK